MANHSRTAYILFALTGALFFLPFLGGVHLFDWDEINFAEAAREMLVTGRYDRVFINYEPFWEKPPLFLWMQALSMRIFGVGEFAARFPNAVCGIITLLVLYRIGSTLYDHTFGVLWSLTYLGSVLPHFYFRSGIIDPWFNLFIFIGLYGLIRATWRREGAGGHAGDGPAWIPMAWGGAALGLAILTKGPVALLLIGLTAGVYWALRRFRFFFGPGGLAVYLFAIAAVAGLWLGLETLRNGPWFARQFTLYQIRLFSTPDAGHTGFPAYHFVVLLIGCFPASVLALRAMGRIDAGDAPQSDFRRWMLILFWVVLLLFSIVESKIVHYSSLAYFPITWLAALSGYRIWRGELRPGKVLQGGLIGIGGFYIVAVSALAFLGPRAESLKSLFSKDPFAQANLDAPVNWSGWEFIPGLWLLIVLVATLWQFHAQRMRFAFSWLYGGTAIFVFLGLVFFIARVEGYSQRTAVNFYKDLSEKDCYVITSGFKSYAHLFYLRKTPPSDFDPEAMPQDLTMRYNSHRSSDPDWLLNSQELDRDVYVVSKITGAERLRNMPQLEEQWSQNGFVVFRRTAPNPAPSPSATD